MSQYRVRHFYSLYMSPCVGQCLCHFSNGVYDSAHTSYVRETCHCKARGTCDSETRHGVWGPPASAFVAPASLVLRSQQHPWLRSAPSREGATEPTVDPLHIAPGPGPSDQPSLQVPPWVTWPFCVSSPPLSASGAPSHPLVLLWTFFAWSRLSPFQLCSGLGHDPSSPSIKRKCGLSSSFSFSTRNSLACSSPGLLLAMITGRVTRKHFQAVPTLKMLPRPGALSSSSLALLFKILYWEIYYGQWG